MNNRAPIYKRQRGMSLIEMMIAMTISLIVIGAVSGVYLSTSRNYTQDEMLSRMQENARYALHVLSEDLGMAGYWGPLITSDDINAVARDCDTDPDETECLGFYTGSSLSVAADDDGNFCAPGTVTLPAGWASEDWAHFIQVPIEVEPDVASATAAHALFECIPTSPAEGFAPGSDILVVKRVEGQELASDRDVDDDEGDIFIRTNGFNAMLFTYATDVNASEGPGISDWRYRPKLYYVRNYFLNDDDGIPTLVRKSLNGNVMETEDVAQGIERFRVLFGVDSNSNATADFYTASPAVADLNNITSARIYVLARSMAEDPNYLNDKVYQLGDVTIDYSASADNDNYYRRVFTTTVSLRNQRNRISTTGK